MHLSLSTLMDIQEAVLQVREALAELGYAQPFPQSELDALADRARKWKSSHWLREKRAE